MLILITTLVFSISNPKPISEHIWAKKTKIVCLPENWDLEYLKDFDSYHDISFLNFQPLLSFWANFG